MSEEAGKINAYHCDKCNGKIITKNRDEGTTPFMIDCEVTPACTGTMRSQFYRVDQRQTPTHEWFKPKTAGERRHIKGPLHADHVKKGGLLLRQAFH